MGVKQGLKGYMYFEIGELIGDSILGGGARHFFLPTLYMYNFENIVGAHPPDPSQLHGPCEA